LICFWKTLRDNPDELIKEVRKIKETYKDGRKLYNEFTTKNGGNEFERAVRFFVLNRITFSGTVDSGGYSQQAFEKRFTDSAIEKLKLASEIIKDFEITHGDYEKLLFEDGEGVFIFLDPPYIDVDVKKYYGIESFDHKVLFEILKDYPAKWLMTINEHPLVYEYFDSKEFKIEEYIEKGKGIAEYQSKCLLVRNYE